MPIMGDKGRYIGDRWVWYGEPTGPDDAYRAPYGSEFDETGGYGFGDGPVFPGADGFGSTEVAGSPQIGLAPDDPYYSFQTGEDVVSNYYEPELNKLINRGDETYGAIQDLINNPIDVYDPNNTALWAGIEGLQGDFSIDYGDVRGQAGLEGGANQWLMNLSQQFAGGGMLEPGAEFGQINELLANQTGFEDLSLYDDFTGALGGGPDVEGNRFLNALFEAGTDPSGGAEGNAALDKMIELIDQLDFTGDTDDSALQKLLAMVEAGPDYAGVQTAVEGATQATVDRLYSPGGAVEQGLSQALRQNIRTGFGPSQTGDTDRFRLQLGEAAATEVGRSAAESTIEAALGGFGASVASLAQVAASPAVQDPRLQAIDSLSRASQAISAADLGQEAQYNALARGADISLGTEAQIYSTQVGALQGALSDEAAFVQGNQQQALTALTNMSNIRAQLDSLEAQLASETAMGAATNETQLNITKLEGSLRAAQTSVDSSLQAFTQLSNVGLELPQMQIDQRMSELRTLADYNLGQGALGETIASDVVNYEMFRDALGFSREQFEESKRQWDEAMELADGDCNKAKSIFSSAATGAAVGTMALPGWGTLAGGVAGFVAGLFGAGC